MEANGTRVLGRDEILAASDITTELVRVPEWGKDAAVWVRALTGQQRDAFELAMVEGRGKNRHLNLQNLRARMVVASVVESDEPGAARLFKVADIGALGDKSAAALQRVFEVAQRLSGLTDEDVEELTTDLGEDLSGDSGSG